MPEQGIVNAIQGSPPRAGYSKDYAHPDEILGHEVKVISVVSGKGGVGKTSTVVNLAIALSRLGLRITVLDADLGLGNIDIMLGLTPEHNLEHVLRGQMAVEDILIRGPADVMILPASSGVRGGGKRAHFSF
ncbi:P-loop NTPase [Acidobacteriota bacterium]